MMSASTVLEPAAGAAADSVAELRSASDLSF